MQNTVVLGNSWGDEAKGRLVDYLAPNFKYVVRASGGCNAGHTIIVNDKKYVARLVPSAALYDSVFCVLGQGMVIDTDVLHEEIKSFNLSKDRLLISENAHIILPWHKDIDAKNEEGPLKIGTTKKGIGPAYQSKARRTGLRMGDLKLPFDQLEAKIKQDYLAWNCPGMYFADSVAGDLLEKAKDFNICDTAEELNLASEIGAPILFEGAQGTMLDIDNGTYPYVTSSNTTIGGILTGSGVSHKKIGNVIGCIKAYTTRVGDGPFETEIFGKEADELREAGNEYGSVTKRPRRVGWLDLTQVKKGIQLNGIDELSVAKLDVFSALDEIQLRVEDVSWIKMKGWKGVDISKIREYEDLPEQVKTFVYYIQKYTHVPVTYLSVSPERNGIIVRKRIIKYGHDSLDTQAV